MSGAVEDVDLVVVGAGPAGSAAAIAALRQRPEARVLLLDRAAPGRDKVCGDGIAPHAVAELERLGVAAVRPEESVPAVRLAAPGGASTSAATASPGYVVPRAVFDARLLDAACAAGARFVREKVSTLTATAGDVTVNGRYRAPVVLGADGAASQVRRLTGQGSNTGRALAVALRGYAPTPPGRRHELLIRWDSRRSGGLCYAWAFPTADGTTNVGYGRSASALTGGRAELVERMRALLPEYDLTGVALAGHTLPLAISRPRPAIGRVLLTGDAAGLVNPLTGEGIYSAVVSGSLAATAALDDPARADRTYTAALKRRFGRQHRQLALLHPLMNSATVLAAVIRAGADDPRLFDRLLDVGLGSAVFSLRDAGALALRLRPVGRSVSPASGE